MAIERIGLDLNATQNWTPPSFNATKTGTDYLREMPEVVNESTRYFFGWGVLVTLFITLYTNLNEKDINHGFGYDEGQSWFISSGITFIFGLLFTMIGFVHNFVAVGVMGGIFVVIGIIIIYLNNNK